jgi:hypothetical protein
MAVVQISRIQVRRGQSQQGSGIPQLASGELGWAVDTRELYIGNGAVSEGAPAVGNTQLLTQYDNLFSVADTYIYKDGVTVVTGGSAGLSVQRTLQARLDDRVSGRSFGLTGETSQVATTRLQTAIDQLFINDATKGSPSSRVVLHLEAGEYLVDSTIYIPPYTTIIGAGADKTIIRTSSTATDIFKTVNSSSTPGVPANNSSSTTVNQATNITLKGLTLETTVSNNVLVLDCCKDSIFEDIRIKGPWVSGNAFSTDVGITMNNLSLVSSVVETRNNSFKNVTINGFTYGISSDWDTNNNNFIDCDFYSLGYGIAFGTNLLSLDVEIYSSKNYGPYNNIIERTNFTDIDRQAIWVKFGKWNSSINNKYITCGNDGAAEYLSAHSIIKYETPTNESENDYFARTTTLGFSESYFTSFDYKPEIEGHINCTLGEMHVLNTLTYTGLDGDGEPNYSKRFRLAAEPDIANQCFEIDYIITSRAYAAHRSGTLSVIVDGYNKTVQTSDDYNFIGVGSDLYLDKIYFDATIQVFNAQSSVIDIEVASQMPSDDTSQIEFKVKLKKTRVDATGE